MTTGEFIINLAAQKGMTIKRLASEAQINYQTLYTALHRENDYFTKAMLDKIADVLGVTPEFIKRSDGASKPASRAETKLFDTIYSIVGYGTDKDREDILYLINSFLEANADLIRDIHYQLKKGEKQ